MNISCLGGLLAVSLFTSLATYGQDHSRLEARVEAVRFPPLARMARIQGDVRLHSSPDGITLISGHPILTPVAIDNLKQLGKLSEMDSDFVYHFVFVNETESRVARTTVKKGNRFERIILRAFLMKTEKVVEGLQCIDHPVRQKNKIDLMTNPIEVWIYETTTCLQTSTSQVAAK
jgi:hypothetical protein